MAEAVLSISALHAALKALDDNDVVEPVTFFEVLPCGHEVCISDDQPGFIIEGESRRMLQPCCQIALKKQWDLRGSGQWNGVKWAWPK